MADFSCIPIVDVHKDNASSYWPAVVLAIRTSSFIAVDCELSGLGNRKSINAKSLDDRYKNIAEVAKTHSIISLGLSCFKLQPPLHHDIEDKHEACRDETGVNRDGDKKVPAADELEHSCTSWSYCVQTFNIMMLCSEDYVVEPGALKFLVEHGFDFHKQYSQGVPYYRGSDKSSQPGSWTLRDLFSQLVISGKSLIVHNGLIDLIFLYQNLYANLPSSAQCFAADLYDMFPGGIYDSKYIADYVVRTPASYLEYIFRKEQRRNLQKAQTQRPHVQISVPSYGPEKPDIDYRFCGILETEAEVTSTGGIGIKLCETYANHGYCLQGNDCHFSHDVDRVLSREPLKESHQKRRSRKRRRNRRRNQDQDASHVLEEEEEIFQESIVATEVQCQSDCIMPHKENDDDEDEDDSEEDEVYKKLRYENDVNMASQHEVCQTLQHIQNGIHCSGTVSCAETCSNLQQSVKSQTTVAAQNTSPNSACVDHSGPKGRLTKERSSSHRAGYDAFMTGFTFASFLVHHTKLPESPPSFSGSDIHAEQLVNKLYLVSKDFPLLVQKSPFSKPSKESTEKLQRLREMH